MQIEELGERTQLPACFALQCRVMRINNMQGIQQRQRIGSADCLPVKSVI